MRNVFSRYGFGSRSDKTAWEPSVEEEAVMSVLLAPLYPTFFAMISTPLYPKKIITAMQSIHILHPIILQQSQRICYIIAYGAVQKTKELILTGNKSVFFLKRRLLVLLFG